MNLASPEFAEAVERLIHLVERRRPWGVLQGPDDRRRAGLLAEAACRLAQPSRIIVSMDVSGRAGEVWLQRITAALGRLSADAQSPAALWSWLTGWLYAASVAHLHPVFLFDRYDAARANCRQDIERLANLSHPPTVIVAVQRTAEIAADTLRIELPGGR